MLAGAACVAQAALDLVLDVPVEDRAELASGRTFWELTFGLPYSGQCLSPHREIDIVVPSRTADADTEARDPALRIRAFTRGAALDRGMTPSCLGDERAFVPGDGAADTRTC
jgi:hypothetical protein